MLKKRSKTDGRGMYWVFRSNKSYITCAAVSFGIGSGIFGRGLINFSNTVYMFMLTGGVPMADNGFYLLGLCSYAVF